MVTILGGGFPDIEPILDLQNPADRPCLRAAPNPSRSSCPLISSSAVSRVHALSVSPRSASSPSLSTPLPRPSPVSNMKMASIESTPARMRPGAGPSGRVRV